MRLVLRLPPKEYEFLALTLLVYWILAVGHAASGFGFLIGIPLIPLIILQIGLLLYVWNTVLKNCNRSSSVPQ